MNQYLLFLYQPSPLCPRHPQPDNFAPLASTQPSPKKETDTAGQACLRAIFGFSLRVTDYFSFPNIPKDFLLLWKIMQRVCRNGSEGRGRLFDKRFVACGRVKYFRSLSKPRYHRLTHLLTLPLPPSPPPPLLLLHLTYMVFVCLFFKESLA